MKRFGSCFVRTKLLRRLLSIETLESRLVPSVTLLTDKPDYAPGETAFMTGSGFQMGETVELRVVRTDGIQDHPGGNLPWQVTDGGVGDLDGALDGNFQTTWFVEEQYAGAALLASASGLTSGDTAYWAFTDAGTSANITSPTTTTPAVLKALPGTVRISFDYSTSSDDGTTGGLAEVRSAGGILVASNSMSLPNTAGGQTLASFIDVAIPAGTVNGSYTVVLTVSHFNPSGNQTDSKTDTEVGALVVIVNPPVLQFISPKTGDEMTGLTFQAVATDADLPNDTLTFSLANAPLGATISSAGAFSWNPLENQDGGYDVDVIVRDSYGNSDSQTVHFTVNEVNRAPTLSVTAATPNPVVKTTTVTFTASATDPDTVNPGAQPNTLTFSLLGAPTGAAINPSTGAFSWTPGFDQDGTFTFTVRVTDNGNPNLRDDKTVSITTAAAGIVDANLLVVGHHLVVDAISTNTNGSTAVFVNGVSAGVFVGFDHILIRAGDGPNTVTVTGNLRAEIHGGADTDIITGGGGDDLIFAGDGADVISGGAGHNTIFGGGGADVLAETGSANFTLTNGVLTFGPNSDTFAEIESVSLTAGAGGSTFDLSGYTGAAALHGGPGADTVIATKNADFTLGTALLTASDGLSATLDQIENVSLTGNNVTINDWTGGGLAISATADITVTGHVVSSSGNINLLAGGNITVLPLATVSGHDINMDAVGNVTVPENAVTASDFVTLIGANLDANLANVDLTGASFTGDAGNVILTNAQVGTTTFHGSSFDVDAEGAVFAQFDVDAEGFDLDATGAVFGLFDVDGEGFDIDAEGAVFTQFDVDAEGFDMDATGAVFGLFDVDGEGFDIDAEGAVFAQFDVDADGFDIDATGAHFGPAFFKGTNFDIDATGAVFTAVHFDSDAIGFDPDAEGFDVEAIGFDIDADGAVFGLFDVDGEGFDIDAEGAVFSLFDADAEGFDLDAVGATFGTASFTGKNFDIDATGATFTSVLFDSDAEGFDADAEGFDIDALDATFGTAFFVGNAFDIDASDGFDVDAVGAHFDVAVFNGSYYFVNLSQATFDQAFFDASNSSITAVGATFDDLYNFAGGTATSIDVSLAHFKSLTNQAENVTLLKADGATFGRLVNEADHVSNISALGATFEVITNSGDFVSGIAASGSGRASSMINYGNNVTGISFTGGASTDVFVSTGNNVSASFSGQGGDDTAYVGGTGVTATLAGGTGNDWVTFSGAAAGSISIVEIANADVDTLDFSSFTSAVSINLASTTAQNVGGGLSMTFADGNGVENVVGSAGADTIVGNGRNNILIGADFADDRVTTVSAWNGRTQVVLLDFTTYTNVNVPGVDTGANEHVYTTTEKNAIQTRMESLYHGPDANPANWWFHVTFTQSASQAALLAGGNGYATIWFNRPRIDPDGSEQPGGVSNEVDYRNQSFLGESNIQINGLLGGSNQAAATTENWVMASANVAAHELAHMMGVRHADAFGPIGYGIHNPPGAGEYDPAYPGPAAAFESNYHLITSPASTGSSVAGVVNDLFFGEREAVRLAMAFNAPQAPQPGTLVVPETAADHSTTANAQALGLVGLNVPNTLRQGLNVNKQFSVAAVNAVGSMTSVNQVDVYSFQGRAGDLLNLEVVSDGVIRTGATTHPINAVVTILDAAGNTIAYYEPGQSLTDDEFESFDAQIIDLRLPADGTYFVKLTTKDVDSDGNPLAITPQNPGVYELFLYRFKAYNPTDGGDVLSGAAGNDVLTGGLGNDTISGGLGADVMNGGVGTDTIIAPDTANTWTFTGATSGTINQSTFASFENWKGGALADTFVVMNGQTLTSTIDGAGGSNTLDLSAWTTSVTANLVTGVVTGKIGGVDQPLIGGVVGHSIQNVIGGSGNDTLTGDDQANVFTGNAGSDLLSGGAGNDTFIFADNSVNGTDTIAGGDGRDTMDFSQHSLGITINLNGGGNSQSIGGGGNVKLITTDIEGVIGTAQADKLTGNALDNFLVGGAGNDDLSGGAGNDVLLGGAGDDILVGGDGNDVLVGGLGADKLTGSAGMDVLIAGDLTGAYNANAADGGALQQFNGQAWAGNYDLLRAVGDAWAANGSRVQDLAGDTNQDSEDIIDDNNADTLTGNGDADWFIIQQSADRITDGSSTDRITNTW